MFGIGDPVIVLGYVLSIVLALACGLYGLINRNKDGESNG
jgi:hypothetical protein